MMLHSDVARYLPVESRAERTIAAASRGHCTAFAVLGEGWGQRMQAESHLELCHLLLLNANREVVRLEEQVRFAYGRGDAQVHVFDVVATWASGERIAFTIKPEARLRSGRFLEEMQAIARWVRQKSFANDVRLLTERDVDPVALHNARIIAAVRDPDSQADETARETAHSFIGTVTLRELTVATGLEARGYRALLRLVRKGELQPIRHERLTPHSLVRWNGVDQ
jgi:hypothetical protein